MSRFLVIPLLLVALLAVAFVAPRVSASRRIAQLKAAATALPYPTGFHFAGRWFGNPTPAQLVAFHRRSRLAGVMLVTDSASVPNWIPHVISAAVYDTMFESDYTLAGLAEPYGDLEGRPGDSFTIPTVGATTPADDLAENVPAVDDKITSGGVTVTVKEAVKSIAWYDRARVQSQVDVNTLAGQRVGGAMNDRIELDLGAALIAGRNTAKDSTAATLNLATVRLLRAALPQKLRRRGVVLLAEDAILSELFSDATILNAGIFGSDEAIRNGAFSRPLFGVTPITVDDGVLPNIGANKPAVVMAKGMLVRAFQRRPQTETERDARARLTRIVGTCFHGEGVVDARGVVAFGITG